MGDSVQQKTEYELFQWGHWCREPRAGGPLGSKPSVVADIGDDRAMEIDRVVGILSLRNSDAAEFLKSKYVQQMSVRELAAHYGVSKDKAAAMVHIGVACVGMAFDTIAANDEKI